MDKSILNIKHRLIGYFKDMTAGATSSVLIIVFIIADAMLIFAGPLKPFMQEGFSILLITMIVINLLLPFLSKIHLIAGSSQETSVVILAVIGSSIAQQASITDNVHTLLATMCMVIALSGLLIGVFVFVLGYFQLGNIVRFIPYPVMVGFIAGTGYLLIYASGSVLFGGPFDMTILRALWTPELLVQWLPAILFAGIYLYISKISKFPTMIPLFLVISAVLFYGVLFVTGISMDKAADLHLFLGPFHANTAFIYPFAHYADVNWHWVLGQTGNIFSLAILVPIDILLKAITLEIETKQEISINKELKAVGIANVASSLAGGGVFSYHSITNTFINHSLKASTRLAALFIAIVCLMILLFGISYVAFLPKFIFAGVLISIGLDLLFTRFVTSYKNLFTLENAVVMAIVITIILFGLLQGVLLGILFSLIIFIYEYSNLSAIKKELTGDVISSNFDRDKFSRSILMGKGKHIHVFRLQGYLFFGNTDKIYKEITCKVDKQQIQFVMLDFFEVSGIDSSSVYSFMRLSNHLQKMNVNIVFVNAKPKIKALLYDKLDFSSATANCHYFATLDYGLEWCEDKMLQQDNLLNEGKTTLEFRLKEFLHNDDLVTKVMSCFQLITLPSGPPLFRQGEISDAMYFIQSGTLEVVVMDESGNKTRLRKIAPGSFVGEIGLYLNTPRSATVVTVGDCTLYKLSRETLKNLQKNQPNIAILLQDFIIAELSSRLIYANAQVQGLST